MKVEFLKKRNDSQRLLLIYAGWSTEPCIYADAMMPGWDLAVVYGYEDEELDTSFLDEYLTIYLFAWSLGVLMAERSLPPRRITAAFAVNGTLVPVNDSLGIPESIYNGTLDGLCEKTLRKFRRRMMPDAETFRELFDDGDDADIPTLKRSLALVREISADTEHLKEPHLPWTRAYIGKDDHIFPPENTRRYWERVADTEIVTLEAAHYIPLGGIVRSVVADIPTVSKKFARASGSYDREAIAQQSVAVRLAMMLASAAPPKGGKILEIGCGTGLFTREYKDILRPSEATFVDIAPAGPFGIAPKETYFTEDAELWMERCQETFDTIVSASAIQWFANIPRFIRLCREHLAPDGVLAISTFLPGNMKELDALRPSPIVYPKRSILEEIMRENFGYMEIADEEICVEFQSAREMLMHLKHTGVGGSSPVSTSGMSSLGSVSRLTYRPVYLIGKQPYKV